jgi:uncharacterized protein (DUF488 family)
MQNVIYTIGHSNLPRETLLLLLQNCGIAQLHDVRSFPHSKYATWFNRPEIEAFLALHGIVYAYRGDCLGGRHSEAELFTEGVLDYRKVALLPGFRRAIAETLSWPACPIVLMCSEANPLDCHRGLLVSRALHEASADVQHILHDGSLMPHVEFEARLIGQDAQLDLFMEPMDERDHAYWNRNLLVGYQKIRKQEHRKGKTLYKKTDLPE